MAKLDAGVQQRGGPGPTPYREASGGLVPAARPCTIARAQESPGTRGGRLPLATMRPHARHSPSIRRAKLRASTRSRRWG